MIAEVDQELEKLLRDLRRCEGAPEQMPPRTKACIYQRASNEPAFDLRHELFRIAGVDLTDVPGISTNTAQTILTEVGPNVARFPNASAFASWLGLSPEKQVSGGLNTFLKLVVSIRGCPRLTCPILSSLSSYLLRRESRFVTSRG
jgi:transposase